MNEFMKKNRKIIILSSVGAVLVILVVIGFMVRSAANSYLILFNEKAEKLLENPDVLNINGNNGFVFLKTDMNAKSVASEKESVLAMDINVKTTDKDIIEFEEMIDNPQENNFPPNTEPLKPKRGDPFVNLDIEKIGQVIADVPGFFAKIGLFFGLGKSSEMYDGAKELANNLKEIAKKLKINTYSLVLMTDKKIFLYPQEEIKGGNGKLKYTKGSSFKVKIFNGPKNQRGSTDIARLTLIPAYKNKNPASSA